MKRSTVAIASIAVAIAALGPDGAMATAQRTFVASYGNDANACSLTQPCRGFAAAVAKTDRNGEVIVLDSAGYGPVTINQPISIVAPAGIYAGITLSSDGSTGITINAGSNDQVILRGITVNTRFSSTKCIDVQAANVVIHG